MTSFPEPGIENSITFFKPKKGDKDPKMAFSFTTFHLIEYVAPNFGIFAVLQQATGTALAGSVQNT